MEVVFLGTGGPRAAGRAASCNLILIHGKARLLVDAGSGAFTRLGELGIGLHDLDTPPLVDKARSKVSTSIQAAGPEAVEFAEDKMRVTVE